MNQSEDIINYAESNGFIRDIEDNVWYTRDYKQRIVPQYYCYHPYSIYYKDGSKILLDLEMLKSW